MVKKIMEICHSTDLRKGLSSDPGFVEVSLPFDICLQSIHTIKAMVFSVVPIAIHVVFVCPVWW